MTLSHRTRIQDQRLTVTTLVSRSRRSFGVATLCLLASLGSAGGFAVTSVAAQDDESCFAVHPNTRSIHLIEGREAPLDIADPCALPAFVVHPNLRSIQLIEGREATVTVADDEALPAFVVHPNLRSIQLIEGREPQDIVADDEALPAFVVHPNQRSIQLIEGKEGPVELAEDD